MGLTKGEEDATPLGLCGGGAHTTQGSACGATLGYYPESRWDSQKRANLWNPVGIPRKWANLWNPVGITGKMCMFSFSSLEFPKKYGCCPISL